jgi:predicted house-cleaning noncanonical NTP pyrophosphatase (MazG superfamily)
MNSNGNGHHNGQTTEVANPSRLATLVGFEENSSSEPNSTSVVEPQPTNSQLPPDPVTEDNTEFSPVRRYNTARVAWSKPGNKAFFVMSLASVAAIAAYLLLSNLTKTPLKQAAQPSTKLEEFPLPEEKPEAETGKYKTETALGDQAVAINKLNEKNKSQSSTSPKAVQTPTRRSSEVTPRPVSRTREVTPRQVISRTPIRSPITREVTPRQVISRAPIPREVISPVSIPKATPIRTEQVKDPMQEWLAASQLGSYGYSPTKESKTNDESEEVLADENEETLAVNSESLPQVTENVDVTDRQLQETRQANLLRYQAEEYPILQETPRQFITAGVKAKAILTTPLAWDETEKSANQDRFIVVLAEPLIAVDGEVALSAKTQLVTQMRSLSESGMVRLVVVAALVEQDGEIVEIPLPNDTIQIRGVEGKPLMAKTLRNKRSQIFGRDASQFVIGAVQKGAEIFNRPRSQSTFGSDGIFSSSTEHSDPNLLAGILEGGSETLLDNLEERNDRALEKIESRPDIRFLRAGSEVEVFVNKSTVLDLPVSESVAEQSELIEESSQLPLKDVSMTFFSSSQLPAFTQFYSNPDED